MKQDNKIHQRRSNNSEPKSHSGNTPSESAATKSRPPRRKKPLVDLGPKFANRAQTPKTSEPKAIDTKANKTNSSKPQKAPTGEGTTSKQKVDPYANARLKLKSKE